MKENVLDVLIYLFENYMFEADEIEPDQEMLALELSQAGFDQIMIDQAFDWLENLAFLCDNDHTQFCKIEQDAIRHYVGEELEQISIETQGLILKLEQCGVLDTVSREMVINQLMALGVDSIDLDHVKWVILMVLSNYVDGEGISEFTEALVLNGSHSLVH